MTDLHVHIQPTRFVASVLPEGHDDRWTYALQVEYRGEGQYAVRNGLQFADADGAWSYEPDFDEDDAAEQQWLRPYYFELTDALRLARRLAKTLTYCGRSVADVQAEAVQS